MHIASYYFKRLSLLSGLLILSLYFLTQAINSNISIFTKPSSNEILTSTVFLSENITREENDQTNPLFVHELSAEEPYLQRILHIRNQCAEKNQSYPFAYKERSFKYSDEVELVMCETPKVASTTWQLLLLQLSGFKGAITKELKKKWDYSMIPNKNFERLKLKDQIQEKMRTYTTFMLVRHPFERLVSAYYDKLSNRSTYTYYREVVGKAVAKKQAVKYMHGLRPTDFHYVWSSKSLSRSKAFRKLNVTQQHDVINYLKVVQTGEISFPQFVKYLFTIVNITDFDIHWRPQVSLCQPCLFNYSYVIKFENVVVESNRLLEYIQKNKTAGKIEFPAKSKPATRSAITEETFKLISEEDVDKLRRIYKDDFRIFDYDPYLYHGYNAK